MKFGSLFLALIALSFALSIRWHYRQLINALVPQALN